MINFLNGVKFYNLVRLKITLLQAGKGFLLSVKLKTFTSHLREEGDLGTWGVLVATTTMLNLPGNSYPASRCFVAPI